MDEDAKLEILNATLERQLQWIRAADTKVSFVLALATSMLGTCALVLSSRHSLDASLIGMAVITFLCLGTSILMASFAAFPRTQGPTGSLVFFQGIAANDPTAYFDTINNAKLESYLRDLADQCHRNAEIANLKYKWIQRSLLSLYVGILPWVAFLTMRL